MPNNMEPANTCANNPHKSLFVILGSDLDERLVCNMSGSGPRMASYDTGVVITEDPDGLLAYESHGNDENITLGKKGWIHVPDFSFQPDPTTHSSNNANALTVFTGDRETMYFAPLNNVSEDIFEEKIKTVLSGYDLEFVDCWELYHVLTGEVHCGSVVKSALVSDWWLNQQKKQL